MPPSAAAMSIRSGAIIPEKVLQHHHKAQGRFGGTGHYPSVNRCLRFVEILRFPMKSTISLLNCTISKISGSTNPAIEMNPAAPDGAPPRRISVCKHMCKHRTAQPCLGEALRRGALIKLQGLMIFIVWVRTISVHARSNRAKKKSKTGKKQFMISLPDSSLPSGIRNKNRAR